MRPVVYGLMAVLALGVTACGSKPIPRPERAYNCIGFADDLSTLKVGDELPRVVQVLGMPSKAYRVYSPFGRSYDIIEYKVGESPCVKAVLRGRKGSLPVVFDANGEYVGYGEEVYSRFRRSSFTRVEALQIDPVIFKP